MEQEDRELLIKDLCCRLPYGVKCQIKGEEDFKPLKLKSFIQGEGFCVFDFYIKKNLSLSFKEVDEFKPYLFPISSMTNEQKREYHQSTSKDIDMLQNVILERINGINNTNKHAIAYNGIDWLNAHHFDYRGLIEKGLAIDATGLNIY